MRLEKLHIKNYKSLVDLEIIKPNPFTVFAGSNGAGKSNIFEALEFVKFTNEWLKESAIRLFGGSEAIIPRILSSSSQELNTEIIYSYSEAPAFSVTIDFAKRDFYKPVSKKLYKRDQEEEIIRKALTKKGRLIHFYSCNRIFIKNADLVRVKEISDDELSIDCSNLEKVLRRLLEDEKKREDITEYLEMFLPGFDGVKVHSDNLSEIDTLLIYEKGIKKPFTKDLISDGTYNILCLLTALFQSDEPQFLCIEEPENGLNPYVIQEFVELCRLMCEDHGHYIWLNTHSQTLVRMLKEEELILVDKENGATKVKQFGKGSFHGLKADEAWLTNSLGAGIPW